MDADPKTLELDKDAPRHSMQHLVLDCDFCGRPAEAVVTHQGTGRRWQSCIGCIDARRMRRRTRPYTVEIIQNDKTQAPT